MSINRDNRLNSGFVLYELLPAAALLAAVATVCLKGLALDRALREKMELEMRLVETLSMAREYWIDEATSVIFYNLDTGPNTDVVEFPDDSWLPRQADSGRWIAWRQMKSDAGRDGAVWFAYRMNGKPEWQPWICINKWKTSNG